MANNTPIAKSFKLLNEGPLDAWYGPYASISEANSNVPVNIRWGKKVGIVESGSIVDYWWPNINSVLTKFVEVTKTDLLAKADKGELYQISPPSNTISQSITGNGNTILSAVNDVPATKDELLYEISGRFTGAGVCKFSLLKDKTLVSGSFYRFTKVLDFSVNIPGAGQQVVDVTSLAILLKAGYYLGINKSSTSMPYYGIDASVGFGWYQVASGDFIASTNAGYSATANFAISFKTKKDLYVNQTQLSGLVTTPQLTEAIYSKSSFAPPERTSPGSATVLLANNKPALLSGLVGRMTIQSSENGIAAFQVIKRLSFNIANPSAGNTQTFGEGQTFTIPVTVGMNTYDGPSNVYINEGDFVAQYTGTGLVKPCIGGASTHGWWQGGTNPITGSQNLTFQLETVRFGFEVVAEKYLPKLEYYSDLNPKYTEVTATRNANDYNSIHDLINTLLPIATKTNRYIINVPTGQWFECDIQGTGPYIEVKGAGMLRTVLYCDSKNTAAKYIAPADYSYIAQAGKQLNAIEAIYLHVIFLKRDAIFSNLTIKQIRGKYALHADNQLYKFGRFTNVMFEESECNYPVGIGINGGQRLDFFNPVFKRAASRLTRLGVLVHNAPNQTQPAIVNIENGKYINCGYLTMDELGSDQADQVNLINCQTDAVGHVQWMVDKTGSTTYWKNPATGVLEPDPTKVPYCLNLNASGTKVDLVDSVPTKFTGFPDERPLKLDYSICDYWGMALNDNSQVIEPGDLLVRRQDFSAIGTIMDTMMKVVKLSDMNANLEIVGVALEANQANPAAPVVTTNFKYAPKGKIAPTKVTGAVTANAGFKLAVVGTTLQSAPTTPIKQCDAVAYMNKDVATPLVLAKLL